MIQDIEKILISEDALQARTTFSWPPRIDLPGYRPVLRPHSKQIREAAKLIAAAQRPILYIGGGVISARRRSNSRSNS